MKTARLFCICMAVSGALSLAVPARAVNSVVVESKTVVPGATAVPIHVMVTNDVAISGMVLPLEIRSVTSGAYIASLRLQFADRLATVLWSFKQATCYADPDGSACRPGGYHTISWSGVNVDHPVLASPEGIQIVGIKFLGGDQDLAPGSDVTGSLVMTVNVTGAVGSFEIDTTCTDPTNHLEFYNAATGQALVPNFTKGVITIAGNQAPVLSPIGPRQVNEGQNLSVGISATDPNGTIPSLSAENMPGNASFNDNGNGTGVFSFNPDFTQASVYNVRFIASDGLLADTEIVAITVVDTDAAPVLAPIGSRSVDEGSNLVIDISASDPDGAIPTLTAEQEPAHAYFTDYGHGIGRFTFNPDYTQAGVYNVRFIASDGSLADTEMVTITVNDVLEGYDFCLTDTWKLTAGTGPMSVIAADLNSDGFLDLAVANFSSNDISILMNNKNWTYAAAVNYPVGLSPSAITAADLEGDGDMDLFVANNGGNNISVLINNGSGVFAAATNYAVGLGPHSVVAADLDGNGLPDLAVANTGSNNVSILKNNGSGSFLAATNYATGSGPTSVTSADLDGDGDLDLALADSVSGNVSILKNNGPGTFAAVADYAAGTNPLFVVAADVDGDGDLDLAVSNVGGTNISILKNNGTGVLAAAVNFSAGGTPRGIAATDLDGDGDPDLAVAVLQGSRPTVSTFRNNGLGGFSPITRFSTEFAPYSVFAADMDGDGHPDLAATTGAATSGGQVWVLKNQGDGRFAASYGTSSIGPTTSVYATDLDGDGLRDLIVVNSAALSRVTLMRNTGGGVFFNNGLYWEVGSNASAVVAADFDGDGHQDIAVANADGNSVSVLKSLGSMFSYAAAVNYPVGTSPASMVVADLNGDGHPDLATANKGSGNVSVLLNDGTGAFPWLGNFPAGSNPVSVIAGDLDGDGDLDLAVANCIAVGTVSVLKNSGAGVFLAPTSYTVGAEPVSLCAADFNKDGRLDLAAAVPGNPSHWISLLLNSSTGFTAGLTYNLPVGPGLTSVVAPDLDGDDAPDLVVTANDTQGLYTLMNKGWGSFGDPVVHEGFPSNLVTAADLSGDGMVDLAVSWGGVSVILNCNPLLCSCPYQGDMNGNGVINVVDVVAVINRVFKGAAAIKDASCPRERADFNANGQINVLDVTGVINRVFRGGPVPVNPCGL